MRISDWSSDVCSSDLKENLSPVADVDRIRELEGEIAILKRELMMLRIANSELERVVERDTLTPLYNRRYFINAVNDRLKRLGRYGTDRKSTRLNSSH